MNGKEMVRKSYNTEASKKAILDAAEELFAQKGFEATSIQEISSRAQGHELAASVAALWSNV